MDLSKVACLQLSFGYDVESAQLSARAGCESAVCLHWIGVSNDLHEVTWQARTRWDEFMDGACVEAKTHTAR